MNSQLSYTTVDAHREDLLSHAASPRSFGEPRYAPWMRGATLNIAAPRLRAAWRRTALAFSSLVTVATVALVVSLSSSIAAAHSPIRHFNAAMVSTAPLGLVRDPHSHLWTCIRVPRGHKVG